jgi:hypothetical protein
MLTDQSHPGARYLYATVKSLVGSPDEETRPIL